MMKNTFIFLLIISLLLFFACEKEVDLKEQLVEPELVVNSFLTHDSLLFVQVFASVSIPGYEVEVPVIKNATVRLFVDGVESETLKYTEVVETNPYNYNYGKVIEDKSGYYASSVRGETGKTYRLEVSHPDYKSVECETTIPVPVTIERIDTLTELFDYGGGYTTERMGVDLVFSDPAGVPNYYRITASRIIGVRQYDFLSPDDDPRYYIQIRSDGNIWINSDDKLLNPEDDADDFLFGSDNNHFGLFADELIDGKKYKLHIQLSGNYYQKIDPSIGEFTGYEIKFHALSYDAYWYMRSLQQSDYSSELDILTEPVPVYTNVKNGVGIFGASSNTIVYVVDEGKYPVDGITYKRWNY